VSVSTGAIGLAGGLVGYVANTVVSECKAGGNVTVRSKFGRAVDKYITAGGLVGYISSSTISNSYALGKVEIDDPFVQYAGTKNYFCAGGLLGFLSNDTSISINRCFAAGSVFAQANTTGTGKAVHAGGLFGLIEGSRPTINYCVSLNETVIARGGNNRTAARVYANPTSNRGINIYNYAWDSMKLYESATYNDSNPLEKTSLSPANNNPHGADVTRTDLADWTWWTSIAGFPAATFNNGEWNGWSDIGIARGYPRLAWEF